MVGLRRLGSLTHPTRPPCVNLWVCRSCFQESARPNPPLGLAVYYQSFGAIMSNAANGSASRNSLLMIGIGLVILIVLLVIGWQMSKSRREVNMAEVLE